MRLGAGLLLLQMKIDRRRRSAAEIDDSISLPCDFGAQPASQQTKPVAHSVINNKLNTNERDRTAAAADPLTEKI